MGRAIFVILFVGVAVGSTWAKGCWWTGCQPRDWAVTGCGQYKGHTERGREVCRDGRGFKGNKFKCCKSGGGSKSPKASRASISYSQFQKAVTSNDYPSPSQEQYKNFMTYSEKLGKISTVQETAMALAQLLHESDGLRAKREYACLQPQSPQCPQYKTPGCDVPGQYYYGRGYIQLTWCYNYREASAAIFRDNRLVTDPDQVAKNDAIAWQTAFWFWGKNVHNAQGVQQGKFGASTKAINGGIECSAPGNAQAQARFLIYGKVRKSFGLSGSGDPSGCA